MRVIYNFVNGDFSIEDENNKPVDWRSIHISFFDLHRLIDGPVRDLFEDEMVKARFIAHALKLVQYRIEDEKAQQT